VLVAVRSLKEAKAWVAREELRGWSHVGRDYVSADGYWTLKRRSWGWQISCPLDGGPWPGFRPLDDAKDWVEADGEPRRRQAEIKKWADQYERDTGFRRPARERS